MINIKYTNITNNERKTHKTVSVPLPKEIALATKWVAILPDGNQISAHVKPYGLPRADGTRPYALVTVPVTLPGTSEVSIVVQPENGSLDADRVSPQIVDPSLFSFSNGVATWLAIPNPFSVTEFGSPIPMMGGEELIDEGNQYKKSFRFWGSRKLEPIGESAITWEMLLTTYKNIDVVDFTFTAIIGNEQYNSPSCDISNLKLLISGAEVRVDFEETKLYEARSRVGLVTTLPLINGVVGDAQATTISGSILCPSGDLNTFLADKLLPTLAISEDWKNSKEYGIFGILLDPLSNLTDPVLAVKTKTIEEYSRGINNAPFGWFDISQQFEQPGLPGRQPGFGYAALQDIAVTKTAERLYVVKRDLQQESCRPTNFISSVGKWFSVADHPGTWFWNSRPWYRGENNKAVDTLGRSFELADWDTARSQRMGWMGKDRQHWGIGCDVFYTLLDGDLFARMHLRREAEIWIAAHRVDTTNDTINGLEVSRAVGRGFMWAANAVKILDDDALRTRLIATATARLEKLVDIYKGNYGLNMDKGEVQPFDPLYPDSPPVRHNSDLYRHWNPWQEAMIPPALHAWSIILKEVGWMALSDTLKEIAWKIARTVTLHGWYKEGTNYIGISGLQLFEDPNGGFRAPADSELRLNDNIDPYSGYSIWQIAAVLLAKKWAAERNDTIVLGKAKEIASGLLSSLPYDPYDPYNYNHDLVNHLAVVENPFDI